MSEYLALKHPHDFVKMRVRLKTPELLAPGLELGPQERALLKRYARWVDALVVPGATAILYEFKIMPDPGIISQLYLYGKLFQADPDYSDYNTLPLVLKVVWAFSDPVLRGIAEDFGILVEVFSPSWVAESLKLGMGLALNKTTPTPTPQIKGEIKI